MERKNAKDNLGRVLILGMGVTGTALNDYFLNNRSRVKDVDVVDEETLDTLKRYDLAIASPGISQFSSFYRSAESISSEIISEIEFAWRESEATSKWVAITGTNGKTTTTALVEHILTSAGLHAVAVGNIGEASISHVDGAHKIYVAECSSYQLASCVDFKPDIAAILNITPDHISWHKTFENYRDAKFNVLKNMKDDAHALIYLDDSLLSMLGEESFNSKVVTPKASRWKSAVESISSDMKIKGDHNVLNAICAGEIAAHLGCGDKQIVEAIKTFAPLPHRIEPCGVVSGVHYYNDSKATNVDSTLKALSAFRDLDVVLLLGGKDKGTDLTSLVNACERARVKGIVFYGEARDRFKSAFSNATNILQSSADNLRSALCEAAKIAESGDAVLLSPACASFDEFGSYQERGDYFKSLVKDISAEAR